MKRGYFLLLSTGLIFGMGAPVWAAQSLKTDPVEEASTTLSQTLASNQSEQVQLMQMRAQEFSLFKQVGFTNPLLTQNALVPLQLSFDRFGDVHTSSILRRTTQNQVVTALGQGGLNWLVGQSNPAITGFQPIAGRQGLLVSYTIPPTDTLAFLRGRSWTYDNAVGSIALLLQGQPAAARQVLAALQGLMAPNGTLGFSYQVDSSYVDGRVRTGTLAWVGYAMVLYQRQTGDSSFQASAEKIGVYLKGLQVSSGSIKGGPDVSWVSTEHNVDAYFLFRELYRVTWNTGYLTTANQIKNSLLTNHWVNTKTGGNFLQGLNDPTPSLDANSWGAIFLQAVGRTAQANSALNYIEANFKNREKISGTATFITGYSPDAAKKTVWLEGSSGVAVAYQRVGQASQAASILNNINTLQTVWQSLGKWHGALPYAMPRYINSDGDTYSDLESVASTGWLQIALDLQDGSSLFWDRD